MVEHGSRKGNVKSTAGALKLHTFSNNKNILKIKFNPQNIMKKFYTKMRFLSSLALGMMLMGIVAQTASAAILFQDDTFATVESDAIQIGSNDSGSVNTGIQFGADPTASENGNITWDITTNRFTVDHPVDVTGDLTTTNGLTVSGGQVDLSAAAGVRLREDPDPNTNADCSSTGEVIVNTTSNALMICTATGTPGTWITPAPAVPTGATNPATCSAGDLFFNTTSATLQVCTSTNTWGTAGPQDLESVYNADGDQTLTTSNGNFSIDAGTGTYSQTADSTNITGSGAASNAISLDASNAAGGITGTWGTGGLNFSSTTGAFSVTGSGASTVGTDTGDLNLQTTTSGDIALSSAGNITFNDSNLTAPLNFNTSQTGLSATYTGAGNTGVLDALNALTLTSSGQGASLLGINDAGGYFTGTNVESALQELGSTTGANAPNVEDLTFAPQYPDYVISRDGSANNGTLVQDYDATNSQQYFGWTTNRISQQDIDVKFRFPLPADFASTGDFTFGYRTGTTTATDNKVDVTVTDVTTATTCGSSAGLATANVWSTATITAATLNAGCATLTAGDTMEVDVKLYDRTGGTTFADAGTAKLVYNN